MIASGRSIAAIDAIGCGTIGYGHAVVIGLCRSGLIAIAFDISFAAIDAKGAIDCGTGYGHAVVVGRYAGFFIAKSCFGKAARDVAIDFGITRHGHTVAVGCYGGIFTDGVIGKAAIDVACNFGTAGYGYAVVDRCGGIFTTIRSLGIGAVNAS